MQGCATYYPPLGGGSRASRMSRLEHPHASVEIPPRWRGWWVVVNRIEWAIPVGSVSLMD